MAAVLLVDDRPQNLLTLEAILEPLGHELVGAGSGEDALRLLLHRNDFAVILLDVQMPRLDGFETAALIKERERTRNIPIMFLTAISKDEQNVFRGYEVGAVDYVFKPFQPEILRSKVAVLIDLHEKNEQLRRQAEQIALQEMAELRRESAERYRQLADAMPQIVWTADPSGETTYLNLRFAEYTGQRIDAGPVAWIEFVHPGAERSSSSNTAFVPPTERTVGISAARCRSTARPARSSSGSARRPTSTTRSESSRDSASCSRPMSSSPAPSTTVPAWSESQSSRCRGSPTRAGSIPTTADARSRG